MQYLLSQAHPVGRHKARFFSAFGFRLAEWQELESALCRHAVDHEVARVEETPFGSKYVVDGPLQGADGRKPYLRTVWFIESGRDSPYFRHGLSTRGDDMMNELDAVVLMTDLPEHDLAAGDIGTVVMVHEAGRGYEVEFVTLAGETLAVITLKASEVRPIARREIAHVRKIAA